MADILSLITGALVVGNLAVDAYELVGRVWSLKKIRERLDAREGRLDDFLDGLDGLNANLRLINQGVLYAPDVHGVHHMAAAAEDAGRGPGVEVMYRPGDILRGVRAVRGPEPLVASAMIRNSPNLKKALRDNPFNVFADCAPLTPERAAAMEGDIPVIFTYGNRHFISRTNEEELEARFGLGYNPDAHPLQSRAATMPSTDPDTGPDAQGASIDSTLPAFMGLYDKGEYEAAVRACDDFIQRGEAAGYAYYIRGAARHKLGRHREAVRDHDQALRLQNDLPQARYRLEAHHRHLLSRTIVGGPQELQANTRRILEKYSRALGPGILAAMHLGNDADSPFMVGGGATPISGGDVEKEAGYLDAFLRSNYRAVIGKTSEVLENGVDPTALYYRAKAYAALGMDRRALKDIDQAVLLGVPYSDAVTLQNRLRESMAR